MKFYSGTVANDIANQVDDYVLVVKESKATLYCKLTKKCKCGRVYKKLRVESYMFQTEDKLYIVSRNKIRKIFSEENNDSSESEDESDNVVVGKYNITKGERVVSVGITNCVKGDSSTAYGYYNSVDGDNSSSGGIFNTVAGEAATSFGAFNNVLGHGNVGLGNNNSTTGFHSIVVGNGNVNCNNYSVAVGNDNVSPRDYSLVFGQRNVCTTKHSTVIGKFGIFYDYFDKEYTFLLTNKEFILTNDTFPELVENSHIVNTDKYFITNGTDYSYLIPGMGFANSSSREKKISLGSLDSSYLDKFRNLDIEKWAYKNLQDEVYIGPYAEDVKDIYSLGNGKMLSDLDHRSIIYATLKALVLEIDSLKAKLN